MLTKDKFAQLYSNNPHINKVHPLKKNLGETISELKKENFDFIVNLQKSIRSHKVVRSLKKPSASFPKLNIEKWLLVNFKINKLPERHIVDRYFDAVKTLNIVNDNKGLEFYYPKNECINPEAISKNLKDGYIAWAIGGQHFTKVMPPEKVASVAAKVDLPIVLLGGPEDKERANEIIKLANKDSIFNVCGSYSLNGSASLVEQSKLTISNDTGLMHIAAAFNKPTISIWGNTVPEFGMYPYMPENSTNFVISEVNDLGCRPCSKIGHKKCPKTHFKCMLDQDESFILESIQSLLSLPSK